MSALRDKEKEVKNKIQGFLEDLKPSDRIALIFHDDADGFVSALLFNEFLDKRGCKDIKVFPFKYGKDSINNYLSTDNKIIICDLGPRVFQGVNLVNKNILYIDHHPKDVEIPEEIIEYRRVSGIPASKIVYDILEEHIQNLEWLAMIGLLADRGDKYEGNFAFIRQFFEKNKLKINDFEREAVYPFSRTIIYFEDNLKKAYEILHGLKTMMDMGKIVKYSIPIEQEIDKFVDLYENKKEMINNINFYYFEPRFGVKSIVTSIISSQYPEESFIFATPEDNTIRFSARCQSRRVDMGELMKKLTENLENANAGGHAVSAGGVIMKKDLPVFMERLKKVRF